MNYVLTINRRSTFPIVRVKPRVIELYRTGRPGVTGAQGLKGDKGDKGDPGDVVGADKTYSQEFTGQSTVTVTHNLGKYPAVTVIDSAGDEVEGDIKHLSMNALTVTFSSATGGVVYLN